MSKTALSNQPYLLLVLAPLIWAGNTIAGGLAKGEVAPFTLTFARWMLTVVVLLPFVLPHLRRDKAAIAQSWWLLLAYGALGFSCFNMLLYNALHYTTAINVALIQAAIPMLILLLNVVVFRERLKGLQITGLLLAFVGVALIISHGDLRQLQQLVINRGDVMVLIAALLYALYSLGLRFKPNMSWLSFIFICCIGAALTSLPFALYEYSTQEMVFSGSGKAFGLIIYTAILASLIAQLAYAKGVSLIGASRAGLAINLIPVFGAILAVLILGETLHVYHFIALALVLGGIGLSEYANREKKPLNN